MYNPTPYDTWPRFRQIDSPSDDDVATTCNQKLEMAITWRLIGLLVAADLAALGCLLNVWFGWF